MVLSNSISFYHTGNTKRNACCIQDYDVFAVVDRRLHRNVLSTARRSGSETAVIFTADSRFEKITKLPRSS